ncbi:MAG: hypothetical protein EB079_04160 [Verrucomicrobia bacterium]|nr:hypothetical protein [Verrucomicrobiota bacterium]
MSSITIKLIHFLTTFYKIQIKMLIHFLLILLRQRYSFMNNSGQMIFCYKEILHQITGQLMMD